MGGASGGMGESCRDQEVRIDNYRIDREMLRVNTGNAVAKELICTTMDMTKEEVPPEGVEGAGWRRAKGENLGQL